MSKPILFSYFYETAEVLLQNYRRSKLQKASDNIGRNRELFCTNFLNNALPPRLSIRNGEIWDSKGGKTGQLEIILIRDDCPSLDFGEREGARNSYLVEGVFGVIEVKSNLTREKLREAIDTLRKVKNLDISRKGAGMFSGPILDRPLRCIFSYEGATFETLIDELSVPENQDIVDLICILSRGSMITKGLLLRWEGTHPFLFISGIAASLSFLYYHLVQYSTSFLGRALDITSYFEPLNRWSDR